MGSRKARWSELGSVTCWTICIAAWPVTEVEGFDFALYCRRPSRQTEGIFGAGSCLRSFGRGGDRELEPCPGARGQQRGTGPYAFQWTLSGAGPELSG